MPRPSFRWRLRMTRVIPTLASQNPGRSFQVGGGGHPSIEIDVTPLLDVAKLLYGGPWVAERFAAVGAFVKDHPDAVHPVVRDIILGGREYSAVDAFEAQYALERFRQLAGPIWANSDVLLLPTAPTIDKIDEIRADPIARNSRLGTFTNFMNLLDLAGVAVPAGFSASGLSFGVTLVGAAFSDHELLELAEYRLYALPETNPRKPGLIRTERAEGASITVEIWELTYEAFGSFVAGVPPPIAIGTLRVQDGRLVKGFLCESVAVQHAEDISNFGGWRKYLENVTQPASSE